MERTDIGSHCVVFFDESEKTWQLVGGSAENVLGRDDLWYSKYVAQRPYEWDSFE